MMAIRFLPFGFAQVNEGMARPPATADRKVRLLSMGFSVMVALSTGVRAISAFYVMEAGTVHGPVGWSEGNEGNGMVMVLAGTIVDVKVL
jgi:hypothetical protein